MTYPLSIELRVLIGIVIFAIYYCSLFDLVLFLERSMNKVLKIILDLLFFLIQLNITYKYTYSLSSGYIPIYFILFGLIGFLLYYLLLRDTYLFILNKLKELIIKYKVGKLLKSFIYSNTILVFIKKRKNDYLVKIKSKYKKNKLETNDDKSIKTSI